MWIRLLQTCGNVEDSIEVICDAHVKLVFELRNKHKTHGVDIPLLHAMQAVKQLWLVTMDHLEFHIRTTVAETILRRLLERRDIYDEFKGAMMAVWYKLIEELVFCDPIRALSAISTVRVPKKERSLLHRRIWCDIMHFVVVEDVRAAGVKSNFSVSEMVEFLRFPYRYVPLSAAIVMLPPLISCHQNELRPNGRVRSSSLGHSSWNSLRHCPREEKDVCRSRAHGRSSSRVWGENQRRYHSEDQGRGGRIS